MIPSGYPFATDERRLHGIRMGLTILAIAGSSRFAGTGDFDSLPPNEHGVDVRMPRVRRPVYYVPGRIVPNEGA